MSNLNKKREQRIFQLQEQIENVIIALEDVKTEEELYFENIPENLQGSERAERSEEAIDILEESISNLNEAKDTLDNI